MRPRMKSSRIAATSPTTEMRRETVRRVVSLLGRNDQDRPQSRLSARLLPRGGPADAAWAVYFLIGRKPKRLVRTADSRRWCAEEAGISAWLFDECHEVVGDLAETIALLLPEPRASSDTALHDWIEQRLLRLSSLGSGFATRIARRQLDANGA